MKVSIIIVTWNSAATLSRCVDSILEHVREPEIEILLVDNHSSDPAYLDPYRDRRPCIVIDNPANYGFAKANNIGAARATGDHLLLLNPDMVFLENPLPPLLRALSGDPGLGAIAPLLIEREGAPPKGGYYLKFPGHFQTLLVRTLLDRLPFASAAALRWCHCRLPEKGLAVVEQLPGAFLLFRRDLFPGPRVLDEAYFIWMEDVDFCRRLADRGLQVAVLADVKAVHIGGVSFLLWSHQRKRRIFTESYVTYAAAHFGRSGYVLELAMLTLNSVLVLLLFGLRNLALFRWKRLRGEAAGEASILGFLIRRLFRPALAR